MSLLVSLGGRPTSSGIPSQTPGFPQGYHSAVPQSLHSQISQHNNKEVAFGGGVWCGSFPTVSAQLWSCVHPPCRSFWPPATSAVAQLLAFSFAPRSVSLCVVSCQFLLLTVHVAVVFREEPRECGGCNREGVALEAGHQQAMH